MHVELVEKMDEINKQPMILILMLNLISAKIKILCYCFKQCYNYAYDVIRYNNLDIDVLKL